MVSDGSDNLETGHELRGEELRRGQRVVVLLPPNRFPMLVSFVDPVSRTVRFYSRDLSLVLEVRYNQHGVLYDERGHTLQVFECQDEV